MPASEIKEKLTALINQLLAAIDAGDIEQILAAQRALSLAVDHIWQEFNRETASPREKAIPRLIDRWATDELPRLIHDPQNYHQIKHELRLLKSSLVMLDSAA